MKKIYLMWENDRKWMPGWWTWIKSSFFQQICLMSAIGRQHIEVLYYVIPHIPLFLSLFLESDIFTSQQWVPKNSVIFFFMQHIRCWEIKRRGKSEDRSGRETRSNGLKEKWESRISRYFCHLNWGFRKHQHADSILSIPWHCSSFPGDVNETRPSPDRASEWISFLFTLIAVAQFQRTRWLPTSNYPASSIRVKYSYYYQMFQHLRSADNM